MTLQHTATHCNTLQHTCSVLQNVIKQSECRHYILHRVMCSTTSLLYAGGRAVSPSQVGVSWVPECHYHILHRAMCNTTPLLYAVLQCVAVCCSVLQCVAVCCSVLQCVAVCCSVYRVRDVQYDTSIVCSVAVCCSVLQYDTSLLYMQYDTSIVCRGTCSFPLTSWSFRISWMSSSYSTLGDVQYDDSVWGDVQFHFKTAYYCLFWL